jgi:hypothetical protein
MKEEKMEDKNEIKTTPKSTEEGGRRQGNEQVKNGSESVWHFCASSCYKCLMVHRIMFGKGLTTNKCWSNEEDYHTY